MSKKNEVTVTTPPAAEQQPAAAPAEPQAEPQTLTLADLEAQGHRVILAIPLSEPRKREPAWLHGEAAAAADAALASTVGAAVEAADREFTANGYADDYNGTMLFNAAFQASLAQHEAITKRWGAITAGAVDPSGFELARAIQEMGAPGSERFAMFTDDVERATWSRRWTRWLASRKSPAA
jgi:hypothetical protein